MISVAQADRQLLQLPKELRLLMYEAMFIKSEDAIPLLQSCHQIHDDARPTLYQSPASFSSQDSLFAWLSRSSDANLQHMTRLRLTLTDIDLSPLFEQRLTGNRFQRPTVWTLYNNMLQRLRYGLGRLSSLTALTIASPTNAHIAFRQAVYQRLLESLPSICPHLHTLVLHEREDILERVPALCRVPHVICTEELSRTRYETNDDGVKSTPRPATVNFEDMLKVIHPGRRASSEPTPSHSRFAPRSPGVREVVTIKRERDWLRRLRV